VATKLALVFASKRGAILAIASLITALVGADAGPIFGINGFWDGPH
jgi:hypothetical protein